MPVLDCPGCAKCDPEIELAEVKDERDAALAEVARMKEEAGWRPIESAPKTGDLVQLFVPHSMGGYQLVGCWSCDCWRDNLSGDEHKATLWRPVPAPPTADPGSGGE